MTDFTHGGARLHVAVQRDTDRLTFTLTGELDGISGRLLANLLNAALDGSVGHVDVEMAQVGFVDLSGLRVLLRAYRLGADRGVVLILRDPQPHIDWLLRHTDSAALLLGDSSAPGDTTAATPVGRQLPLPVPACEPFPAGPDVADEALKPHPADTPDERDRRADLRDRRADQRAEQADDRERLADERDQLLDERQQRVNEHQRWEDIREDLANNRERDLERREHQR